MLYMYKYYTTGDHGIFEEIHGISISCLEHMDMNGISHIL